MKIVSKINHFVSIQLNGFVHIFMCQKYCLSACSNFKVIKAFKLFWIYFKSQNNERIIFSIIKTFPLS